MTWKEIEERLANGQVRRRSFSWLGGSISPGVGVKQPRPLTVEVLGRGLSFAPPALTPDLPPYCGAPRLAVLRKTGDFADGTQLWSTTAVSLGEGLSYERHLREIAVPPKIMGEEFHVIGCEEPNRSSAICLRTVRFRDNSHKKRIVWQLTGR